MTWASEPALRVLDVQERRAMLTAQIAP